MHLRDILAAAYDPACQLSASQIEAIACTVRARAPGARLLVFGLGRDSKLWQAVNHDGETLFVEHDPAYIALARKEEPATHVVEYDFGAHLTVASSLGTPIASIQALPIPAPLSDRPFDVILVDGPTGYHMSDPGRAIPLVWTARLMRRETHVFIDDYNRVLERHFTDLLIRFDNPPTALIAHEREAGKTMLWRIGRSLPDHP